MSARRSSKRSSAGQTCSPTRCRRAGHVSPRSSRARSWTGARRLGRRTVRWSSPECADQKRSVAALVATVLPALLETLHEGALPARARLPRTLRLVGATTLEHLEPVRVVVEVEELVS